MLLLRTTASSSGSEPGMMIATLSLLFHSRWMTLARYCYTPRARWNLFSVHQSSYSRSYTPGWLA